MSRRADFARVKSEGRSKGGRFLVLATLADEALDTHRWAFVTSRRVGNAVTRNRIRRRLRAIAGRHGAQLLGARYVVTIARHRAGEASFAELEDDWLRLARRLEILRGAP